MNYRERLSRLALSDAHLLDAVENECVVQVLDEKSLALAQLAALVAVGGAVPSYAVAVDDAVNAGATADEVVDVLVGVLPAVGLPRVVAAAPRVALALGFDLDEALESHYAGGAD